MKGNKINIEKYLKDYISVDEDGFEYISSEIAKRMIIELPHTFENIAVYTEIGKKTGLKFLSVKTLKGRKDILTVYISDGPIIQDNPQTTVGENNITDSEKSGMKLCITGRKVDAIFFHLPDEPFGFLSNWYYSTFELDGIRYTSMEQYIMYQKCILFDDKVSAQKVLITDDPSEQQKIGRNSKGYNNNVWSGARQAIAMRGLLAKFSQSKKLRDMLLDTKDAYLVECANSDTIWACGIKINDDDRLDVERWRGQNILGFTLMEVRKQLRK